MSDDLDLDALDALDRAVSKGASLARAEQRKLIALARRTQQAETERAEIRSVIEGSWSPDRYDEYGEPVYPRGWTLIDGGRYDELEAAETELNAVLSALVDLLNMTRLDDHRASATEQRVRALLSARSVPVPQEPSE